MFPILSLQSSYLPIGLPNQFHGWKIISFSWFQSPDFLEALKNSLVVLASGDSRKSTKLDTMMSDHWAQAKFFDKKVERLKSNAIVINSLKIRTKEIVN